MFKIYKLMYENEICYIGICSSNIEKEINWLKHYNKTIGGFIKKHGKNNFSIIVIEETNDKEEALKKELYWKNILLNEQEPKFSNKKNIKRKIFNVNPKIIEKAKNLQKSKFYVYLLKINNIPFYVGYTKKIKDRMIEHFSGKSKLPTINNHNNDDILDFEILAFCNKKEEALNKEKEYTLKYQQNYKLDNIQIGNIPSTKYCMSGTIAARYKTIGKNFTNEHKEKIKEKLKQIKGFDKYRTGMYINIYTKTICDSKQITRTIYENCKKNIDYKLNDGYVLIKNIKFNDVKQILNEHDFSIYLKYIKKPHLCIDNQKIIYKNKTYNSILELSEMENIPYEQVALYVVQHGTTLDKFNDAKKAEVRDRVKHI